MAEIARIPLIALLLLGGCDDTVPTPAGTIVLDAPAQNRLSVSDWSLGAEAGPSTRVEHSYRWDPRGLGDPIRFRLAFEHGPVELVDTTPRSDKPADVLAPRRITLEVIENDQWAITGKCDDDLSVPLAVREDGTSAYPDAVWARCDLAMKRKNGNIGVRTNFEIYGDGKVDAVAMGKEHELTLES